MSHTSIILEKLGISLKSFILYNKNYLKIMPDKKANSRYLQTKFGSSSTESSRSRIFFGYPGHLKTEIEPIPES
jgi:hypothetical protein